MGIKDTDFGGKYISEKGNNICLIDIDVCGKTYLKKIRCLLYHFNCCSLFC